MRLTEEDKIFITQMYLQKNWGAVRIVKFFPQKRWCIRSVSRLINKIRITGTYKRRTGSGRPRSVRTNVIINAVRNLALSPPGSPRKHLSPRVIGKRLNISHGSVRQIIKKDLKLNIFKRTKVHKLTEANKRKRLACCTEFLRRYPPNVVKNIFFTDEKMFSLVNSVNTQNDRIYSTCKKKKDVPEKHLCVPRPYFSKKIMISLGVSLNGKGRIHLIDKGAKVNATYYQQRILATGLIPDCHRIFHNNNYIFQQDGAPSHTAKSTINFLNREVPSFIKPSEWPPSSPDLNPMDYAIWPILQQSVYEINCANEKDLFKQICKCWKNVTQITIKSAILQWRKRLQKCVEVLGSHIEQYF